jgi:hypothetical protein
VENSTIPCGEFAMVSLCFDVFVSVLRSREEDEEGGGGVVEAIATELQISSKDVPER